ncbi:MAG TPA: potassium transporter TrkG [Microbacteriaceae bacterium]|nr:potassium transporter TrkG [Microbacteriaceae bacterium]
MRANPFEQLRVWVGDFMTRSPSRFALTVFSTLILVFTALFSLPAATAAGQRTHLVDAFFTAVSTICVTGLSTVDMGTHWSPLGHAFILIGTQIGGIGVLTMASILGLVITRRLGLRQKLVAASDSNPLRVHSGPISESQAVRLSDTRGLLVTVATSMLVIEGATAVLLLPRLLLSGMHAGEAVWQSVFLAAMAFTNTGFTVSADGIQAFAADPYLLIVLMIATVLGAIGFPVIYSLRHTLLRPRRWSLHVKLTLSAFVLLWVGGWIVYIVLEWDNTASFGGDTDFGQRLLQAAFLSTMTRSGGFATFDTSQLEESSILVTSMLMFVGGGSASTAGGIKVTTLAILFLAAVAEARGRAGIEAFGKFIPSDVLRLAVSVTLWGATLVAVTTTVLLWMTDDPVHYILFDVISAFATCGLSTGFTADAPESAQTIIAIVMFLGRIGTATFAAALAARQHVRLFKQPEERPIVG